MIDQNNPLYKKDIYLYKSLFSSILDLADHNFIIIDNKYKEYCYTRSHLNKINSINNNNMRKFHTFKKNN